MNDTDKRALVRLAKVLRQASLELEGVLERNGGAPPRRKPYSRKSKRKAPPAPAPKFWDTPPPPSPPRPTKFWND